MKYLVTASALFVCIQCTLSITLPHPGAIASQLADLTNQAHHLVKRQTYTASLLNLLDCTATASDYQCSSGYNQRVVDIALECGGKGVAIDVAGFCDRRENGDLCIRATSRFIKDTDTLTDGMAACVASLASGTCSPNCSSILEMAGRRLGCCLNSNFTKAIIAFNDSLWDICNVRRPPDDCVNDVSLDPPQNPQFCSSQELMGRIADYTCMPSIGQPLVDALLQNGNCNATANLYVDGCSSNTNGETCFSALQSDFLTDSTDQAAANNDPLFTALLQSCPFSPSGNSGEYQCDASCQSAVNNIDRTFGCCLSAFNISQDGEQASIPQLAYGLWQSCGVEPPGVCVGSTLGLSRQTSSATVTKVFAASWMVAIVAAIYVAGVIH